MMKHSSCSESIWIEASLLEEYKTYLYHKERSNNTIKKYARDLRAFFSYLNEAPLTKDRILSWKDFLVSAYAPSSVNSMLAAVNGFLDWYGIPQYKVKPLKIQHSIFLPAEKELTREEYCRLINCAQEKGDYRLCLILQTLGSTGIRISELPYIHVSSLCAGRTDISCKGKLRTIFLPQSLCRILTAYCQEEGIASGPVFCTRQGKPLDRSNIWKSMKSLCQKAQVPPQKVFPHNLRHLFARTYYSLENDLSRLADLLGHSSINTTRIYTMESGAKHLIQLNRMDLIPFSILEK